MGVDNKGVIWAAVGEPLIVWIMPKPESNDERNAAVMKSRQAGATFAEIGRQHGLSRKRARGLIARKERDKAYLKDSPFKSLGLSNRLLNALVNSGFETIEQVANASDEEILMLRNVGKVGLLEIKKALVNWRSTLPARATRPSGRTSLVAGSDEG